MVSVWSPQDGVQSRGYSDGNVKLNALQNLFFPKQSIREIHGFDNIKAELTPNPGLIDSHNILKTAPIWDKYVIPNLSNR